MTANVVNQVAFLRTTREFPHEDQRQLAVEVNKAYIDTSNAVNNRIISIFPTSRPAITGESWFINQNKKQGGFRQVYAVTSTSPITHGIDFTNIFGFSRCWGQFTNGTNWYGFIFGGQTAIAGQIVFYLTPTQITFVVGAGAPAVTTGTIVLEWLSRP